MSNEPLSVKKHHLIDVRAYHKKEKQDTNRPLRPSAGGQWGWLKNEDPELGAWLDSKVAEIEAARVDKLGGSRKLEDEAALSANEVALRKLYGDPPPPGAGEATGGAAPAAASHTSNAPAAKISSKKASDDGKDGTASGNVVKVAAGAAGTTAGGDGDTSTNSGREHPQRLNEVQFRAARGRSGVLAALVRAGVPHLMKTVEKRRHPSYVRLWDESMRTLPQPLAPNPLYPVAEQ